MPMPLMIMVKGSPEGPGEGGLLGTADMPPATLLPEQMS